MIYDICLHGGIGLYFSKEGIIKNMKIALSFHVVQSNFVHREKQCSSKVRLLDELLLEEE